MARFRCLRESPARGISVEACRADHEGMNTSLIQREIDDLRARLASGLIPVGSAAARLRALERRLDES